MLKWGNSELKSHQISAKRVDNGILLRKRMYYGCLPEKVRPWQQREHGQSPVLCDGGLQNEDSPWQRQTQPQGMKDSVEWESNSKLERTFQKQSEFLHHPQQEIIVSALCINYVDFSRTSFYIHFLIRGQPTVLFEVKNPAPPIAGYSNSLFQSLNWLPLSLLFVCLLTLCRKKQIFFQWQGIQAGHSSIMYYLFIYLKPIMPLCPKFSSICGFDDNN